MEESLPQNNLISLQVIGVGGGGSNAVNRMLSGKLEGVDLFIINTDAQASLLVMQLARRMICIHVEAISRVTLGELAATC